MSKTPPARSSQYRRKAAGCGRLAERAGVPSDRERLARMQESWIALAANEDWLDGIAAPLAADGVRKLSS
jgi:hypothetical protein